MVRSVSVVFVFVVLGQYETVKIAQAHTQSNERQRLHVRVDDQDDEQTTVID